MRNHNDKTRDMARSVLPSTARRAARQNRRIIHGRERAAERRLLHDLLACPDPDDYDNDVAWEDRPSRRDMIIYRRNADKVGSLIRWAERTVATHPRLADATLEDRLTYFRAVLPPDSSATTPCSTSSSPSTPSARRGASGGVLGVERNHQPALRSPWWKRSSPPGSTES